MNRWIPILSFLDRACRSALGQEIRPHRGHKVAQRAGRFLARLGQPQESISFQVAVYQLRNQYDLLDEEFIEEPKVIELQQQLHRVAQSNAAAQAILTDPLFGRAPIFKLTEAIICQAKADHAKRVKINFGDGASPISVLYNIEGSWREAMAIPARLSNRLRQSFVRLEALSYPVVRPYMGFAKMQPDSIVLCWLSKNVLTVDIE